MKEPEFVQWCGFFETAENFYNLFLPQAKEAARGSRTIEELSLPLKLAARLDASFQPEYHRLWSLARRRSEGPHERG